MDMLFKNVSKDVIMIVHAHRLEHDHDNLTHSFECIVREWKMKNK